ncbi:MAG: hypothetical protein EPO68_00935 [Planctomycetota bacterium]|nr:MAG: hypothetical protein EPO68_00935 [Planctomycetota bacterium]
MALRSAPRALDRAPSRRRQRRARRAARRLPPRRLHALRVPRMKLCIQQPAYWPWLGFIDRVARCDVAILLDHVALEHNTRTQFTNRNKVRTADGWTWLTVPVRARDERGAVPIERVEIADDGRWRRKHLATLRQSYGGARGWGRHAEWIESLYAHEWSTLAPLVEATTRRLLDAFEVGTPLVRSSALASRTHKSQLVLDLCLELGADCYLSGPFGRDYLDRAAFERAGVRIEFHDYAHPEYEQLHAGFHSHMSALDLALTHPDRARAILGARMGEALAA